MPIRPNFYFCQRLWKGVKPTVHLRYSVRQVCHATCVTHAYVRNNPTLAWQMTCLRKSQPRDEVSEFTDAKRPRYERLNIWHGRRDVRDRVDGQRALDNHSALILQTFTKEYIPKRLHHTRTERIGDLVLVIDDNWIAYA